MAANNDHFVTKASLVVRSPAGAVIEIGEPVPVDPSNVIAETLRLRRKWGRHVHIDADQIVSARAALGQCRAIA